MTVHSNETGVCLVMVRIHNLSVVLASTCCNKF